MSSGVKLAVMGVAGAALLYSCAPSVGAGLGALPYLWFLPNPFYRPPIGAAPCPPGQVCPPPQQATGTSDSSSRSSSTSTGSTYRSSSTTGSTSGSSTSESGHATSTTSQRGGFGSTGSSSSSSS